MDRLDEIRQRLAEIKAPQEGDDIVFHDLAYLLSQLDAARKVVEAAGRISKSHEPVRKKNYEGHEYLSPAGITIDGALLMALQDALDALDAAGKVE